jgi:hypothetical protein
LAHDLLQRMAEETNADILLVCEPNRKLMAGGGWYVDRCRDAAIKVLKPGAVVAKYGSGEGHVWIETGGCRFVSVYVSPNSGWELYEKRLEQVGSCVRNSGEHVLLAGDFNAKSPVWGAAHEDARGAALADLLAQCDVTVLNRGNQATFVGASGSSIIDVTCASAGLAQRVGEWRVEEQETTSDHRPITYRLLGREPVAAHRRADTRWEWREDREEALALELRRQLETLQQPTPESVTEAIGRACDTVLRRGRPPGGGRRPVYWWTPEVASTRRECLRTRRRLTRSNRQGHNQQDALKHYRDARKALRLQIRRAKDAAWKKLIQEVDENPWGRGYRIATRKFVRTVPPSREEVEAAVTRLFPVRDVPEWRRWPHAPAEMFTEEELEVAVGRLAKRKAPGPDGIPPEAVRTATRMAPRVILAVMNGALEGRTFPERWRRAKLVLIPKDDGTEDRKFRPICLIDALGKVLEHLIKARLQKEVDERGGLSDNQFGFRQGLSTMDAVEEVLKVARFSNSGSWGRKEYCGLVALDVENAFNTASWERIVTAMDAFEVSVYVKEMIQTYLTDRTLIVSGGLQQDVRVSCGVPQGSVLGPILWNIMYDGVLRLEVPVGVRLVAFADDLAVMAMAATKEDLQNLVNRALERVSEWMRGAGLRLAARKTEAVLLTGKRRPGKISFYLDGEEIVPRETIRYLGVRLDRNMTFGAHVEEAAAKAGRMADALGRIMPNVGGARSSRRRLLAAVVHSKLLYGAPAWAGALKYKRNTDILVSAQRRALLRIASAYKTTSAEAIQVITGVLPVDLQVRRLNLLYRTARARSEVDEALLCEWQRRWVSGEKAAWTRTLIPDISMWVKKKHGELDYHLTQALTGHGCFATFLRRIGKEQDDRCWYCGGTDDVEHTLFVCEEWDGERLVLMKQTMHWPEKDNFAEIMLRSREDWEATASFVRCILIKKERREREREAEVRPL